MNILLCCCCITTALHLLAVGSPSWKYLVIRSVDEVSPTVCGFLSGNFTRDAAWNSLHFPSFVLSKSLEAGIGFPWDGTSPPAEIWWPTECSSTCRWEWCSRQRLLAFMCCKPHGGEFDARQFDARHILVVSLLVLVKVSCHVGYWLVYLVCTVPLITKTLSAYCGYNGVGRSLSLGVRFRGEKKGATNWWCHVMLNGVLAVMLFLPCPRLKMLWRFWYYVFFTLQFFAVSVITFFFT